MNDNKILAVIKVIVLLFISNKSFAQADLFFENGVTLPNYDAVEFDFNPVIMNFRVNNQGTIDAGDGGDFFLGYNNFEFTYDSFSSTTGGWSCGTETGGLRCISPGPIILNTPIDFQLQFIVGSTTLVGIYPFNGTLTNNTGNDINTANNLISTQVNIMPAVTDYEMMLGGGTVSPTEILTTTTGTIPFSFNLRNIGNTLGFGETANIVVDAGFTIGNLQVTGGGISTWNCNVILGNDWDCVNTGPVGMAVNNTAVISGDILTYPTVVSNTVNAIVASISEPVDTNLINNSAVIDVNVSMPVIDTDLNLQKFVKDTVGGTLINNIPLNTPFVYNIHVNNPSLVAANNVVVTDNLPLGIQATSDLSEGLWNCNIGAFINATTSQLVTCTHPSIAASQPTFNELIYFGVQGVSAGVKNNTASVVSTENDSNLGDNNNAGSPATINITAPLPDIIINKDAIAGVFVDNLGTDVAEQGSEVIYKILAINNTPGSVNGSTVMISDTLPAGISYVSHNVIGPNFICNFSVNTMTCNAPSLPFTIAEDGVEITVNVIGASGLFVDNTASVTASNDIDNSNNSDNVFFTVVLPPVDLAISKDAQTLSGISQGTYEIDENFKYVLTVNNSGVTDAPAGEVIVTDTLPADMDLNNTPAATGWDCSASDLVTNIVSCVNTSILLASTPSSINIPVSSQVQGNYNNTAIIALSTTATVSETNTSNNTSNTNLVNIVLPATPVVNLTLSKDAQIVGGKITTNNFLIGEIFEYKLTTHNIGPEDAPIGQVQVIDNIPAGIDIVSGLSPDNWTCNVSGNTVTCTNDVTIAASTGFLDLIIPVSSQVANNYTNSADVSLTKVTTVIESDITDNNASFVVTINPIGGDLTLSKTVSVGDLTRGVNPIFSVGDTIIYTILAQNNSATNIINDLVISDVLDPTFLSFVSFNVIQSAANFNCSFDGFNEVVCANSIAGPFNPGDSFEVEIRATATVAGTNLANVAHLSSISTGDDLDSAPALIDVSQSGNLNFRLDVSDNVDPVELNKQFSYLVFVENNGTVPINTMDLKINIPNTLTLNSFTTIDMDCNPSPTGLLCSNTNSFSLDVGESATIVNVKVKSTSFIGNLGVVAQATANNQLQLTVSESTTIISNTIEISDLSIVKTASDPVIAARQPFSYTLTVFNNSEQNATNVKIVDDLPKGLILKSINASNWTCNNTTPVMCNIVSLQANETSSIVINVLAPAITGLITNTAQVTGNEQDDNSANNSSQANVNVTNIETDISVTKKASVESITSGEQFSWSIEIVNNGPGDAKQVEVTDQMPSGFEVTIIEASDDAICNNNNNEIKCTIQLLPAQQTNTITITGIAVLESGVLDNIANVSSQTNDTDPANNTAFASVVVQAVEINEADLAISVSNRTNVDQGESFSFELNASNIGPDAADQPMVNVLLSGLLDVVTVNPSNDWVCQVSGLEVSCQFNAEKMQVGGASGIRINAQTQQVVMDAQNITLSASISSNTDDPSANNNSLNVQIEVAPTPSEEEIHSAMQSALAGRGSQQVNRAIRNVSSYCERKFFSALEGLCRNLYETALEGDGDTINNVMEQITPSEVIGQSTSVAEIATAQFKNIGARLSQLRGGGGGGFSTAGLNARYGNGSIPLGMLSYLNQSEEEKEGLSRPVADFISPWGFFVNGTISMGERDATGRELGFDFDSYGLTAGIDYRLDSKKVIGLAIGYANFDSEIGDQAEIQSTGVTLTGYGSFYVNDNFYVDARISYGRPDFDQSREIDFTIGETHIQRTAKGTTTANQYSVAMSAGYHFNKKSWNITPNASFNYVKTNINAFTETGAGGFNFLYSEQDLESLVWSLGVKVTKAISLKNGVITPQFDIDYNYESKNDGNNIVARFLSAPTDELFIIETDSPDRSYGSAGLGLVYITSNGKQAYINYRSVIGLEGFNRGTFNVGARFEF